jgi:hypothetical protein
MSLVREAGRSRAPGRACAAAAHDASCPAARGRPPPLSAS